MHKFVDDSIIDTKLDMENVKNINNVKDKHAIASQNIFRRVVRNAESIGMKVNAAKTSQIYVSDSMSYKVQAHVTTMDGQRIECGDKMKILGFYFGNRPNCTRHVQAIRKSFRGNTGS